MKTNLIKNPSFEVNVTDETTLENNLTGGSAALTLDATTSPVSGGASAKVVITAPANAEEWRVKVRMNETSKVTITNGQTYTISGYMKASGARNVKLAVEEAAGAAGFYSGALALTTSWQRFTYTFTASSTLSNPTFNAVLNDGNAGTIWLDQMAIENAATSPAYFDGATDDDTDYIYAWSGTAHNSTSTATEITGANIVIEGTNRTSKIDWQSVQLDRALTSQVDTLKFSIIRRSSSDYKPALIDDIFVVENNEKIFGGQIIEINNSIKGSPYYEIVEVTCKDYTYDMDKNLVVATYENETVDDIIADINTNFLPSGYTITNVDAPITIGFIAFNYEYASKCLQQLAELIGYDWYVDPDKNIYFFAKSGQVSPFNLTDTNGKYIFSTLKIKNDVKNIRNSIIVRGGEYRGDTTSETVEADGTALIYKQGQRYSNVTVTVNAASKTVGVDNIDDPASFDCLYNFQEKFVRFKAGTLPAAGHDIVVGGNPHIPVIVKVKDNTSIAQYGEFQYKVVDKSIESKQGARDRAKAEITSWAAQINDGSFRTYEMGLEVGQQINVQSDLRVIDEDFIISKISSRMRSPTEFEHGVTLMTKMKFGIIEFLQKLLIQKDKEIVIDENEVVDEIEAAYEEITLSETLTSSLVHNPQSETVSVGESTTVQALSYAVEFVMGDYPTPTGVKRQFVLDGSPLH